MCNLYTQTKSVEELRQLFAEREMVLTFPEGAPNLPPGEIRISDNAPIVRAATGAAGAYELVTRRWSWPGPGGKPVFNFRSEGRQFGSGRCLIVADGFYEYTTPQDPKQKKKDRWLFTAPGDALIGIAGLIRDAPEIGEAFTMLTTEPGPDVARYHGRQVALLAPAAWRPWLDGEPSRDLIGPVPAGTLEVRPD